MLYCVATATLASPVEKPLIIITASYNNAAWCHKYFTSIAQQTYHNWFLIYIDDNSSDGTLALIQSLAHEYNLEEKIQFIRNTQRKGHLHNQYHAIHRCPPNSIILIIDGDDWLANEHVFQKINTTYQDENVWLTYGQFWYLKKNKKGFCKPIPPDIIARNGIREISWRTSHLRTFYAGLFQHIKLDDLLFEGEFFPKCADVVTMFAMIEMAGNHIQFIPDVLYIYNDDNPLSYHHDPTHQRELEACIRKMPQYQPLQEKTW
jgi:glycosyltransferase involved in cell wall biosynthesis